MKRSLAIVMAVAMMFVIAEKTRANMPIKSSTFDYTIPPFGGFEPAPNPCDDPMNVLLNTEQDPDTRTSRDKRDTFVATPAVSARTNAADNSRTMIAGVALSLAMITGGLWLVRRL